MTQDVIIDGVRYVPVAAGHMSARALMRALALTYTTEDLMAEEGEERTFRDLRVSVGEWTETGDAWDGAPTIDEFVGDFVTTTGFDQNDIVSELRQDVQRRTALTHAVADHLRTLAEGHGQSVMQELLDAADALWGRRGADGSRWNAWMP